MPLAEESVYEALRQVRDPELLINVVDLGLIYAVKVEQSEGGSDVHVTMGMTTPACPYGPQLIQEVRDVLGTLPGIGRVEVQITLSPPWTPDRLSEEARDELGLF